MCNATFRRKTADVKRGFGRISGARPMVPRVERLIRYLVIFMQNAPAANGIP